MEICFIIVQYLLIRPELDCYQRVYDKIIKISLIGESNKNSTLNHRYYMITLSQWLPTPNVMAALPNIGGALYSTPQFG